MKFWFIYFNICVVVYCVNELHLIYLFFIHGHLGCFLFFFSIKVSKGRLAGSYFVHIFNLPRCEPFTLSRGVSIYSLIESERAPDSSSQPVDFCQSDELEESSLSSLHLLFLSPPSPHSILRSLDIFVCS